MTFGEKIRYVRKKRKMSQKQLADLLEIHENLIGRYENDATMPTAPVITKICEALDVPADYLLLDKDEKSISSKITDNELLKQFETIEKFSDEDKKVIKILIDAFISKNKIKDIVSHKAI